MFYFLLLDFPVEAVELSDNSGSELPHSTRAKMRREENAAV
jgi:hypothetical protein